MKCSKCGREITVYDRKCPYCRAGNPFAVKHEKNMKEYEKSFNKTQKAVGRKMKHLSRASVIGVFIGIAAFAAIVYILIASQQENIKKHRLQSYVKEHKTEIVKEIQDCVQKQDYSQLKKLGDKYDIYAYNSEIKEYYPVIKSAQGYLTLKSKLEYFDLFNNSTKRYYSEEEIKKEEHQNYIGVASAMFDLYSNTDFDYYSKDGYQYDTSSQKDDVISMLADIRKQGEKLIKDEFDLKDEDINQFENYSYARIAMTLEGR